MIRCLITGGQGNLGTSLQQIHGWQALPVGRGDWVHSDRYFDQNIDLVIHAAGSLNKPAGMFPVDYAESNVLSLMRTLELMKIHGIKRIFFISSCAVYGASSQTTESSALNPTSINGYAKLLCEVMLEAYCKANNMECHILRLFNIFGGRDRFSVLSHLKRAILEDKPFYLNNQGRAQRDFVHVDDVSQVIFRLAEMSALPKAINIGSGVAVKISEVVDAFMKLNPGLKTMHRNCSEVEYSRADIDVLRSVMEYEFQSVYDTIVPI